MNTTSLDKLVLAYPDSFRLLTEEEASQYNRNTEGPTFIVRDDENHIIISCGYRTVNGITAKLLSEKDLAKSAEEHVARAMKPYGYKLLGKFTKEAGGEETEAFRYTYTAQEIAMSGETLVHKDGKQVYYINIYYRTGLEEESLGIINGILKASSWNGSQK